MKHQNAGRVTRVEEHPDGKHAVVHVKHGRTKKPKNTKEFVPYEEPKESRVVMPKHMAAEYGVGSRVHVGINPRGAGAEVDADEEGPDHELQESPEEERAEHTGKKAPRERGKSLDHGPKGPRSSGAVLAAMRSKSAKKGKRY